MPSSSSRNRATCSVRAVEHREVAVIVGWRLREDPVAPADMRPFAREHQVVRVDHAGRVRLAAKQRADGVALAADVVAVLADEHVERSHLEVLVRHEPVIREVVQRDQRRLRRVARADRDDLAAEVGDRRRSRRRTRTRIDATRSRSVSRMQIASRPPAETAGDTLGLQPRQRRVPGDVDVPRRCASTWRS